MSLAGDAELYALSAYYLQQNQQAQLRHVRAKPAKAPDAKGALPPHKSTISLTWDVENPDEDRLRYRLFFRNEAHSAWLPILREHELLEQTDYEWETRTLPDGYYRVRVEVSDEASNPARVREALRGHQRSRSWWTITGRRSSTCACRARSSPESPRTRSVRSRRSSSR